MSSTTGNTIPLEVYQTPPECVAELVKRIRFKAGDTFLEPCKSSGNIYNAVNIPLANKYWCEIDPDHLDGQEPRDFLEHKPKFKYDVIITNPPFSLSAEFLEHARSMLAPDGTLIFLQRMNWLGSGIRVPFWERVTFPEKTPIIVPRPKFVKGGSDSTEYCWFIWDYGDRVDIPDGVSHIVSDTKEPRNKGIYKPYTRSTRRRRANES